MPARKCDTLDENKAATADVRATIVEARTLAQDGKSIEAEVALKKAMKIEKDCFGALRPTTNWAQVRGDLYAIEAMRTFPIVPEGYRLNCARKKDVLGPDEVLLCGPGFIYSVEIGKDEPYALAIAPFDKDTQPVTAQECDDFLHRILPTSTAQAKVDVNVFGSPVHKLFFDNGKILGDSGFTGKKGKGMCFLAACRKDVGKRQMGGKCEIPSHAVSLVTRTPE